jgi:putative peptide zinc metalloprotease protein
VEKMQMTDLELIKKEDHYVVLKGDQYFRLGISEGKVLTELKEGHSLEEISEQYDVSIKEIERFICSLEELGVLGEKKEEKKNWLFYRIKLIDPDKYFEWIVDHLLQNKMFNRLLILLSSIICLSGVVVLIVNRQLIFNNISYEITVKNILLLYAGTILTVFCHELGHGLVCKYYGGKVKEIGFLFICGSPALFCDVSGIREFNEKRKTLATLLAGVSVQFIITAISVVVSVSINGTNALLNTFIFWNLIMMLSNLLPVTKLDGYWILSTLLNIPNLYDKSIKLALGKKKNVLFNKYEESKAGIIKFYGIMNLFIMAVMITSMILGISKIKLENGNVLSTGLTIFQGILGLAMVVYLLKMVLTVRKENETVERSEAGND